MNFKRYPANRKPDNRNPANRKPDKIWVHKGNGFYNRSMKSWLEKNAIEMYSTRNEKNLLLLTDL